MLCNNFLGFACWKDLILSEFQNQFYACSAQPGNNYESGSLFDIKMTVSLQGQYIVLLNNIEINSILILLMAFMLYYMLGEDDV